MNGAPYFHVHWVQQLLIIFSVFPYLQKLFSIWSFCLATYTGSNMCNSTWSAGPRHKNYPPSFFLLPCTKFFLVAPDKKMPLANRGAQFCTQFQGHRQQQRKQCRRSWICLVTRPSSLWVSTHLFKADLQSSFSLYFSEYAGELSPSLRNGIYAILIGSTALTMCCFGLYCRIYVKSLLDCCETCCRHKRGQHRVPTS